MNPVWLPLAGFWFGVGVFWMLKFRKTRRVGFVAASVASLIAAGAFVFLALQTRPQVDIVNAGKENVLVTVEGELEMKKLVPTQQLTTRYSLGARLTIRRVTDAGPAESKSFALPDGKDKEIFKATVRTDPSGAIQVEFSDGSPP